MSRKPARTKPGTEKRGMTVYQLFQERAFKDAVCVVTLILTIISLVSLWGGDSEANPIGIVGRWIAVALMLVFGKVSSYPFLVALFVFALASLIRRKVRFLPLKLFATLAFTILLGTMISLVVGPDPERAFLARKLSELAIEYLSALGAILATAVLLIASAMLMTGVSIVQVFSVLSRLFGRKKAPKTLDLSEKAAASRPIRERASKPAKKRERAPAPSAEAVKAEEADEADDGDAYVMPSPDLLDAPERIETAERESVLLRKGELIVQTLADHGIEGEIVSILPGPIVTRFEFRPARGVKLSRIMSLADDLALAMKAKFVPRIAPIRGKSVVGLEVANENRRTISFHEVISSSQFAEEKSTLKIGVGTDIAGNPSVISLNDITHLLIAGATGSGKSVCINCILTSLLYSAKPEWLELILIDPKMLELSLYNDIPHLREPVVTDVGSAELAFRWAVSEMDMRYQLLAERKVRHIDEYNQRVLEERKDRQSEIKGLGVNELPPELKTMPYLVIVVDELADLMLSARQAIEVPIIKLAAKARAAGIHLVLATQRPSVDVVTGLIKTNFPSRLAFRVAQKVDSRTILDQNGAESLLGKGDMLFLTPGAPELVRLHGAYITEREVERLVTHLRKQPAPVRESSIFDEVQQQESLDLDGIDDPQYKSAVEIVVNSKYASISLLQRKLQIGHSRAARYIDMMEQQGIVGPFRGSKPREVLVDEVTF